MDRIRLKQRKVVSPWAMEHPKREALRAEKRDAIMRVAARLFAEKGVELTTMDEIAGVLGITKPTMYRIFKDKAALYQACQEQSAAIQMNGLREARAQGRSASEQLRHYFLSDLHMMMENDFGRMQIPVGQPDIYSNTSRTFRKLREELEQGVREILNEGIANREFKASLDPKLVALALFATFNLVARWFNPRGSYTLDEIAEHYFALFLDGLRAR